MREISEATCCVIDSGLFVPMANRLSDDFARTIYWSPDQRAYPSIHQSIIGDGFRNIDRVDDLFEHIEQIDLFVFPDCHNAGLQTYLESQGHLVWGSRHGVELEHDRVFFLEKLAELGMEVPVYTVVHGLGELRNYLKDKSDKWIKVSKYRGDFETAHWRDMTKDSVWLDRIAIQFGPLQDLIEFIVMDPIDTDLEIGADTYNIVGRWPSLMLNGIEWKDKSYFAAVTPTSQMPEQVRQVLEAFGPVLQPYGYRNQWSMEIRVKDDKSIFTDPTCRGGMPSSGSQQLLWKNFSEIVYHGAAGELVEPEPAAQFSIECMIKSKTGEKGWDVVDMPHSLNEMARFSNCGKVGNCYVFPENEYMAGDLGWLVATGDSPTEVLDEIKAAADELPDGLDADVEDLAGVIKEIESAHEAGIPFTRKTMPRPAAAIED